MTPDPRARIAARYPRIETTVMALLCACSFACAGDTGTSVRPAGAAGTGQVTVGPPAGQGGGFPGTAGVGPGAAGVGSAGQAAPAAGAGGGMPGAAGTFGASGTTGSLAGTGGAAGAAGVAGAAGMAGVAGTSAAGAGSAETPVAGEICERWAAARTDLSEGTWTGSIESCDPGDMSASARMTALGLVNLYRSMAGLEPVEMSDEGNRLAQGCALLMAANGRLSHMPPSSWTCYTQERADAAGTSSLAGGGAVSSVDGYMIDPGNPTTIGHRRWILSNMLAGVGFGSTGRFSCQYQPARRPPAGAKPWVAWPPAGQVPFQALSTRFANIDQTGWTVQSDTINFASAQVTVTSGGMDLPVTVTQLGSGYGSRYAMRFNPMGWSTQAGQTYSVRVDGVSMPIAYDVEVVDCR